MVECVQLEGVLNGAALRAVSHSKFIRVYQPLKWSYGYAKSPAFVRSKEFIQLLESTAGVPLRLAYTNVVRFERGDYTVLYDALKSARGFIFFLDVNDVAESWGGYTSFVKDGEEVVRVVAKQNVLSVIKSDGLRFFTKYLNHQAKSPRVFILGVALPK